MAVLSISHSHIPRLILEPEKTPRKHKWGKLHKKTHFIIEQVVLYLTVFLEWTLLSNSTELPTQSTLNCWEIQRLSKYNLLNMKPSQQWHLVFSYRIYHQTHSKARNRNGEVGWSSHSSRVHLWCILNTFFVKFLSSIYTTVFFTTVVLKDFF